MEIWVNYLEGEDKYEYGVVDGNGKNIPFHEAENLVIVVLQDFIDVLSESGSRPLLTAIDGGKSDDVER